MIYLITLGYVPNKLFRHTAKRLTESLSGKREIRRIFVQKPYPLNTAENLELNRQTCQETGYEFWQRDVDSGAAGDFNLTLQALNIQPNDAVICYDHDSFPVHDGWDYAMVRVLEEEPKIDWVTLWHEVTAREFQERGGHKPRKVAGFWIREAKVNMMVMASMFRGSFLLHCGGLIQPFKYYGGIESAMALKLQQRGTRKAFLRDYWEDQRLKVHQDDEYMRWKNYHVRMLFPGSFAEFVQQRCPQLGKVVR